MLDRRRIYVLPTRFGLFVAALLLAMLLGALNYNNNPALLLALLLATAGIASSIMAHLQLSALRIEAASAEPVIAGEPLRMRVSLARRDTRTRRGLRLDHLESNGFCSLIEHDMAEVDLLVPTERRGWQDIERIRLSSTQPLGLVRAWSWVWPETPLLAIPSQKNRALRCPMVRVRPTRPACTRKARNCISYARIAPAMHHARFPGNIRHVATRCWCANTKSRWGSKSRWTGARSTRCRTSAASRGWRAGSTWPNATGTAIGCCCRASRRWVPRKGLRTITCVCAPWPCFRMTEPSLPISQASRAWVLATSWLALTPLLLQLPGLLAATVAVAAMLVGVLSWRGTLMAPVRLLLVIAMLAAVYWQIGMRFGRDTGCAVLAAMLAIKACELRTLRDARSLLGFALFAPFAAFLLDQGPATMGLALLAVVSALLSMQRLADEEHRTATPALRMQLRGIGKLVAIGVPLALVTFWLLPRLSAPLWGVPERALSRPGLSDNMLPGEWIDLMADDSPALRVQFTGKAPPPQQRYWRGPVMWDFDGRTWQRARWTGRAQPASVTAGPQTYRYRLDYEPTDRRQLVSLDLPTQAVANAELSPDYELFAQRPLSALTRWDLQSAPPTRFDTDLPDQLRKRALALPPGFNPRTLALARQWRSEAGKNDDAVVQRALRWITREFAYTLDTPLLGRNSVDEFLFQQKAGFCEHFSSSFVVLMRAAGIPARVVTGYAGGTYNRLGDYWVVRRMDAHAWTEIWLAGRGWVRVDPTAAVAPERIYDTLEDRLQTQGGNNFADLGAWASIGQVGDWLRRGWNELVLSFDADRQQRLLQPFGIDRLDTSQLAVIFGVFAVSALAWMGWLLARGERERDPLLRAWHRLSRRYRKLGLAREPHEPAIVWAQRVARSHPKTALLALSQRFAAARYAGTDSDSATLLKDLLQHRPRTGASS